MDIVRDCAGDVFEGIENIEEVIDKLEHFYTRYLELTLAKSSKTTGRTRTYPHRRGKMLDAHRALLAAKVEELYATNGKRCNSNWTDIMAYAESLMCLKDDDIVGVRQYLQDTTRKFTRQEKLNSDPNTGIGNAPRANGGRSKYLHLEIALFRVAKLLHPDLLLNMRQAEAIVRACIQRLGGSAYQGVVDLVDIPSSKWIATLFRYAGYRWRQQAAERDHVDVRAALRGTIALWPIIKNVPLNRIFNADQTNCELTGSFNIKCLTKKGSVSKDSGRGGDSFTQFSVANMDGTKKSDFFLYVRDLMGEALPDFQLHLNEVISPAQSKKFEEEAKAKYAYFGDEIKTLRAALNEAVKEVNATEKVVTARANELKAVENVIGKEAAVKNREEKARENAEKKAQSKKKAAERAARLLEEKKAKAAAREVKRLAQINKKREEAEARLRKKGKTMVREEVATSGQGIDSATCSLSDVQPVAICSLSENVLPAASTCSSSDVQPAVPQQPLSQPLS
ncbi:YALI0A17193p [Yarrowia lipolytica CLIB122]|uniref:YALI0A17193p n=2 Tax=Yarrowia lipolytica TaxID=4952 RepID=Q6CGQ9_YARLI|nr:YALI0A17193p [Yarrowia lipolytica CLIB122]AOW00764.1 hypothetical protein YALI1_A17328g [Yarrowia lipolytica]KAB8281356.1 hypothetical protein BKA91DRAFT_33619 [Yarrowia lipolytica]KAE8169649.1 hypothetical protein BKA90DRAFT_46739 [Yarrowia lipolytica]KAJ8051745.1 hypothetical protein LXG23DRAFT_51280 [Yarrowia lipolytica]RMI95589.1 hypothetical protein BD777DRAFT_13297 [Yarrowia lipolytica]|eukprot:XP_500153.1 YALI0A17193p [Yarrowia lipolytica CLIB122]